MPADRPRNPFEPTPIPREYYRSLVDDWIAERTTPSRLEWGVTPPQRAERRRRRRRRADERQLAFVFMRRRWSWDTWTTDFNDAQFARIARRQRAELNRLMYFGARSLADPLPATAMVQWTPTPVPIPAETMWCRREPCGNVAYNARGEVIGGRTSSVPRAQWREHLEAIHGVCGYCEQPLEDGACPVAGCNVLANIERSNET